MMAVVLVAQWCTSRVPGQKFFRILPSDAAMHIKAEAQMAQQPAMETESLEMEQARIQLELTEKPPS